MTVLHMESFDPFGGTIALMLDLAAYTVAAGSLVTTPVRTGTHAYRANLAAELLDYTLDSVVTVCGQGCAINVESLPAADDDRTLMRWRDSAGVDQVSLVLQINGSLQFKRGGPAGTAIGPASATFVVGKGRSQWLEARVLFNQTVGTIEARVDSVPVISATGLDTVASALVECGRIVIGGAVTDGNSGSVVFDDWYAWDNSGTVNKDFIGPRSLVTLYPSRDQRKADWTPTSTPGHDMIDDTTPDDDVTNVASDAVGDESEFEFDKLPPDTGHIDAVRTLVRARGDGMSRTLRPSLELLLASSLGAVATLTTSWEYFDDIHELDPEENLAFKASSLAMTRLKFDRVT